MSSETEAEKIEQDVLDWAGLQDAASLEKVLDSLSVTYPPESKGKKSLLKKKLCKYFLDLDSTDDKGLSALVMLHSYIKKEGGVKMEPETPSGEEKQAI